MHDGRKKSGESRVEYADLLRRRVPDTPTLAGTFRNLLKDLAPAIESGAAQRERKASGGGNRLEEITGLWQRTVGDDVAALSRPVRFRGGVLTVEVDSAPLAAELGSFARDHLVQALAAEGLEGLCDLKFRPATHGA